MNIPLYSYKIRLLGVSLFVDGHQQDEVPRSYRCKTNSTENISSYNDTRPALNFLLKLTINVTDKLLCVYFLPNVVF